MVCDGSAGFDFVDRTYATVAVRHDDDGVAFANVSEKMATESSITAAVLEVPALTFLFDGETTNRK